MLDIREFVQRRVFSSIPQHAFPARNSEKQKAGSGHPGRLFSSTIIRR
jgi:hypothetical protein